MEFKGTKGKWKISDDGVSTVDNENVFEVGCGCCTSGHLDEYDQLLISKAPEMLELLKKCDKTFNGKFTTLHNEIKQLIKEATEL